ncbi:scarecrow-like protein 9 [Setaria italica]|nr:scarecrow-like protein 9 [Setaria italica]
MTITPELEDKQQQQGVMAETTQQPSPSVFLDDLPLLAPCIIDIDGGKDDSSPEDDGNLVLPYISRMLMEDITGEFSDRYNPDHPALLKAQQPFAEILSNAIQKCPCKQLSQPAPLRMDTVEAKSLQLMTDKGSSCVDVVSMAFFKGMEEANKFLPIPTDSDETVWPSCRRKKKRLDRDDETTAQAQEVGMSTSKQMAASLQPAETEEEAAAREMLDRLMLNGYDHPSLAADMLEPPYVDIGMIGKTTPPRGRRHAVDLHTLLIRCAEAVASNDYRGAADLLERIKHHSSPTGDGTHRLAHCFAMGLEARLAGTGSQIYRLFMDKLTSSTVGVLKAYQFHMTSCCFLLVQHLFSNKTIYNAVTGRKKLHIVHYGLGRGLQWPDLLRWLARRDGGPPEVRLTGIDNPQPRFRPAQHIEETGHRLSECARRIGVPFRFRGIAKKLEAVQVEDLDIDPDEVLVINSILHLQSLMDESVFVERSNPRDMVLSTIRKMRPSVFIHAVNNGSHSSAFFMTRFREVLHSYTALFDMMDAIAPRDDDKRLLVERDMFAACITNIIACEGMDRVQRPQSYKQWQIRSQRAGLRQLPLDPEIVQMLKDKVKKEYHKSFVINEDQHWLLQGWKGRVLYALSMWTADDDRSVLAQT